MMDNILKGLFRKNQDAGELNQYFLKLHYFNKNMFLRLLQLGIQDLDAITYPTYQVIHVLSSNSKKFVLKNPRQNRFFSFLFRVKID